MKDNIILIGMMGSGKTTVGKALAKAFKMDFLDLDEAIIKQEKMSIPEIFYLRAEGYFRALETQMLERDFKNTVISTGGGIVKREENIPLLKALGKVFYLSAPAAVLYARIKGDPNRPLLGNANEFEEVLNEREPIYRRAGYEIDATQSVDEIVKCVAKIVNIC